MATFFVQ